MTLDTRTIDVQAGLNDGGRPRQVCLRLGPREWELLTTAAEGEVVTRTQMARRLICMALRQIESA